MALPAIATGMMHQLPCPMLLQVARVEGRRLHVRVPEPAPSPPMNCVTCWLAATWPWLPLPALPRGININIRTRKLQGWMDL
jgi:hypothetical protein